MKTLLTTLLLLPILSSYADVNALKAGDKLVGKDSVNGEECSLIVTSIHQSKSKNKIHVQVSVGDSSESFALSKNSNLFTKGFSLETKSDSGSSPIIHTNVRLATSKVSQNDTFSVEHVYYYPQTYNTVTAVKCEGLKLQ